jgi:hypothetical protein
MAFEIRLEQSPQEQLSQFFEQLRDFLEQLILEPEQYGLVFTVPIQDTIREAFERETLAEFDRCEEAVNNAEIERLAEFGLAGASLRAKMLGLNLIGRRLLDGIYRSILYLFKLINSLLESIGKALGVGDAVKEIKDLTEATTDFVEDVQ